MAAPNSLDAQFGIKEESTFGTYVAPDRFVEFTDESMSLTIDRVESGAMRSGSNILRNDRQAPNRKGAAGDVSMEVATKGFGLLMEQALGSNVITTPGGGTTSRDHTITIGSLTDKSFTAQIGRPDIGGTVRPFSYTGCKVTSWELSCDIDGFLTLRLSIDSQDETTDESLATASYASGDELLVFNGGSVTIGGSGACVRAFSVSGDNALGTDRYCIGSSSKKQQLEMGRRSLSGSVEVDFEDLTHYARFQDSTEFALVATFQGSLIEGSIYNKLQISLPVCRADGETPTVSGIDTLRHNIPFTALDNGTDEPVEIVYTTTDTAS